LWLDCGAAQLFIGLGIGIENRNNSLSKNKAIIFLFCVT